MPRLRFAQLPTPLEEAANLSKYLGGPRILFKRDDLTASALGGNKVRKLEFILGRIVSEGYDTLIVPGGYQSNMARISAALANKLGLNVELVLGGAPEEAINNNGNLLLEHLLGANITYVNTVPRWDFGSALDDLKEKLQADGLKPYLLPLGGSSPEGMAGYVEATLELKEQCRLQSVKPDRLFVAIGSGGTYSGLLLGALNNDVGYEVTGISVSRTRDYLLEKVPENVDHGASLLDMKSFSASSRLSIYDEYIGDSYGAMTDECKEAIQLVAKTEGVFLDPVYSGKCMAGMIDLIQKGEVGRKETVIFLHTGGWPALFAYESDLIKTSAANVAKIA
ncbi:D-cysteine desulfhydrase family protein [Hyphococcus sp.]|uniref:D-cysteine desulfhydrase family protein n=1 Tax=Hyphococcus sp. TaxID=2038636 RepID=UPI003CCB8304